MRRGVWILATDEYYLSGRVAGCGESLSPEFQVTGKAKSIGLEGSLAVSELKLVLFRVAKRFVALCGSMLRSNDRIKAGL